MSAGLCVNVQERKAEMLLLYFCCSTWLAKKHVSFQTEVWGLGNSFRQLGSDPADPTRSSRGEIKFSRSTAEVWANEKCRMSTRDLSWGSVGFGKSYRCAGPWDEAKL